MLRGLLWLLPALLLSGGGCGDDGDSGQGGATGAQSSATSTSSAGASDAGGSPGSGGSAASGGGADECPTGTRCIPDPPDGWSGPGALYLGETALAGCEAPWTADSEVRGILGELSGGSSCTPCSCDAPSTPACTAPTVTVFGSGSCGSGSEAKVVPASGACVAFGGGYGATSTASNVTGGTCSASGGALTGRPTWRLEALFCGGAPDGGRCSAGLCAVEPAEPFGSAVCIHKVGDEPCPAGFPARTVVPTGVSDKQSCSSCSCAPSLSGCDVLSYANTNCANLVYTLTEDGACNSGGYYQSAKLKAASAGPCIPSGGQLSGTVEQTDPVTFCCVP